MCASKENFDCQQTTLQSYDCEHCIFKTHHRVAFYNHLRHCHANLPKFSGLARPKSDFSLKWYSCKICKQFTTCSALHLLKHEIGRKDCASGLQMLNCPHCSYKTLRKDVLKRHIIAQHFWFQCDQCDYKAKMKTCVMRHIALYHRDNVSRIYCNFCGHKTKTMNAFKRHMKRRHSQWEKFDCQKATLENYECNFCDFKIHLRIVFHYHMSLCHDTLPKNQKNYIVKNYDCTKCNQFTSSSALHKLKHEVECLDGPISHIQNLHNKKYKCTYCSYEAFKQHHLQQHINTKHTTLEDNEWYKCSWCDYKGKVEPYLVRHIKIYHSGDAKWIYCNLCEYKTLQRSYFDAHFNIKHASEDKIIWFKCDQCEWKTKTNYQLKQHVKFKHTKMGAAKRYKCDNCEYKTRWKTSLKRHINSKHTLDVDAMWYRCNYCEYKTKAKFVLTKHVAVKHCNF